MLQKLWLLSVRNNQALHEINVVFRPLYPTAVHGWYKTIIKFQRLTLTITSVQM